MIIFFNGLGIWMIVCGVLGYHATHYLIGLTGFGDFFQEIGSSVFCALVLWLVDFYCRIQNLEYEQLWKRLIYPAAGGHLMFLPIWLFVSLFCFFKVYAVVLAVAS